MPRNGSGVFTPISPDNPVVASTLITATKFNNTMTDVATALTNSIAVNGESTVTANIPMNNNKLTGLAAATATGDAIAQNKQMNGLLDISGAAAGQVKFPAAQNASSDVNTLDDYEEGTWTPKIHDATGSDGEGQTYSTQAGFYTKIGDLVTLFGSIRMTSVGTLASLVRIAGFPFTVKNTTNLKGMCIVTYADGLNLTTAGAITGIIDANSTYAQLVVSNSTTGTSTLTPAELSNDGAVQFTIIYKGA